LDLSDIQEKYSRMMEGLARVHDGSADSIGLGYWLMNIIGINHTGERITPLYNKLYSFKAGARSENSEILEGIFTVVKHIGKQLIWVIDRGGDRTKLIVPLLRSHLKFIIRSKGKRNLIYRGKVRSLKWISRKVNPQYRLETQKIKKNRIRKEVYYAGAVPVRFINEYTGLPFSNELWLVVLKGEGKGYRSKIPFGIGILCPPIKKQKEMSWKKPFGDRGIAGKSKNITAISRISFTLKTFS